MSAAATAAFDDWLGRALRQLVGHIAARPVPSELVEAVRESLDPEAKLKKADPQVRQDPIGRVAFREP